MSNENAGNKAGKTFNVKRKTGVTPEGKAIWENVGRVFIREDGSGGAAFIGQGESEKVFNLFPKDRKPQAAAKPEAAAQPAPAQSGAWA